METDPILERAIAGDAAALESLLARYQDRVYRFGLKMCGDADDAADVLQDTLMTAARALPQFRRDASLSTWLYTIARSYCIKKRRRGKFAPKREESLEAATGIARHLVDVGPDPESSLSSRETAASLARALASLAPSEREVLVLRDVEGLTAPEAAEVLGISEGALKSRLHRARAALRALMTPLLDDAQPREPGCPDVIDLYSRRLEGEIDAALCRDLATHLEGCPRCRVACDALQRTLAVCASSRDREAVPPEVQQSVRRALRDLVRAPALVPPR